MVGGSHDGRTCHVGGGVGLWREDLDDRGPESGNTAGKGMQDIQGHRYTNLSPCISTNTSAVLDQCQGLKSMLDGDNWDTHSLPRSTGP